jgi:raffinose/stachyose/melibiose transport system permease protein
MISEKKIEKRIAHQILFTGPTILAFVITILIPFIYGFYLTLMDMKSVTGESSFNGINNYITAFQDDKFWSSLWLTVKYVIATVFFTNLLGFALAFLVTSGVKGQNFFRTALFTPNLIGGLVLGYIWQFIFVRSLPTFGETFDIEYLKLSFLGDSVQAFWALVIVTIWQSSGYMMIIFIAGIISIPRDLLEASRIDGANGWNRLKSVIMPLMVPSFVVTVFLTLKNAFMVYDLNYSLTKGDPYNSTEMVSMHVVNKAFSEINYGIGQAEAIILFVIVAMVTGFQVYFSKRLEVEA